MNSIKTTGDRLSDLAVATCLMVFGLMTVIMTAVLYGHDSNDLRDYYWGVGVFLVAVGAILLVRPGLAKSRRMEDYYWGALLVVGALLLLCNLVPSLLVYYAIVLLCAFAGVKLIFGHPTFLKLDLGNQNVTIAAGILLIVAALILTYDAPTLIDYLTYVIGIVFILSAVLRFIIAFRGQPATAAA